MIPQLILAKGSGVFGKNCEVNCVWHRRCCVLLQTQILTSFQKLGRRKCIYVRVHTPGARFLFYFSARCHSTTATEEGVVREGRSSSYKVVIGCCFRLIWHFTFFLRRTHLKKFCVLGGNLSRMVFLNLIGFSLHQFPSRFFIYVFFYFDHSQRSDRMWISRSLIIFLRLPCSHFQAIQTQNKKCA